MADELTRKLGYLHVTNEGLSDVQLLSIQLHVCVSYQCMHVQTTKMFCNNKRSPSFVPIDSTLRLERGWYQLKVHAVKAQILCSLTAGV